MPDVKQLQEAKKKLKKIKKINVSIQTPKIL